jgi:hypothetical protein
MDVPEAADAATYARCRSSRMKNMLKSRLLTLGQKVPVGSMPALAPFGPRLIFALPTN